MTPLETKQINDLVMSLKNITDFRNVLLLITSILGVVYFIISLTLNWFYRQMLFK